MLLIKCPGYEFKEVIKDIQSYVEYEETIC